MTAPLVTVVVLAWDGPELTARCAASVRSATGVPHELVVVDNGSAPAARALAREVADVCVQHETNLGFAAGMNAGLAVARAPHVLFLNNDTVLPPGWAEQLLATAARPGAGLVVPAVTAAGNRVGVRRAPGTQVVPLTPFRAVPSGVAYLLATGVARDLGGWDERYAPAGAEDADLCFRVWANGLDVLLDERVLVEHVGKATAQRLPDQPGTWAANRQRLLRRWRGAEPAPLLPGTDPQRAAALRRQARAVAWLMTLHFATVGRLPEGAKAAVLPPLRSAAAALSGRLARARR